MSLEIVAFNGWPNCVRLANSEIEVIVTTDVGPRILRYAYIGQRNIFGELPADQGGGGEDEWKLRGGHRLWVGPEDKRTTYELDNEPCEYEEIPGGVRTQQEAGPATGIEKRMDITLDADSSRVRILHTLTNAGSSSFELAPWALSVMALNGKAIIPLPEPIPHSARLTHNQEWSLWGYTDFSDDRWTFLPRTIFFRQDPTRPPNKLGIGHREGWVAYQLDGFLFIKRFEHDPAGLYPDGGVNFETFANEDILELESLGPLTSLAPGAAVTHEETWSLHEGVSECQTDDDVEQRVRGLV